MNIAIIRTFIIPRKLASNYQSVMRKLEAMEKKYEGQFKEIYQTLNYLISPPSESSPRSGLGATMRLNTSEKIGHSEEILSAAQARLADPSACLPEHSNDSNKLEDIHAGGSGTNQPGGSLGVG